MYISACGTRWLRAEATHSGPCLDAAIDPSGTIPNLVEPQTRYHRVCGVQFKPLEAGGELGFDAEEN